MDGGGNVAAGDGGGNPRIRGRKDHGRLRLEEWE